MLRNCIICDTGFFAQRSTRLYCGNACKAKAFRSQSPVTATHAGNTIHLGDFFQFAEDYRHSIHAIITDPPYGKRYQTELINLATFADTVLVPGGFLIALVGNTQASDAMIALATQNLEFVLLGTLGFAKGHGEITTKTSTGTRFINIRAKPYLWYEKRGSAKDRRRSGTAGSITCNGCDRTLHPWEQGKEGFEKLILNYTNPGETVLDPFMGSGTTGAAAAETGRNFIGIESNLTHYQTAKERLITSTTAA